MRTSLVFLCGRLGTYLGPEKLKNKTVKVKQRLNRIKALKFFCFRKYENTIHSATLDKNVFSEENS